MWWGGWIAYGATLKMPVRGMAYMLLSRERRYLERSKLKQLLVKRVV